MSDFHWNQWIALSAQKIKLYLYIMDNLAKCTINTNLITKFYARIKWV